VLEHVLGKNVDVRNRDGTDRTGRFAVRAEGEAATCFAAKAGAEATVALFASTRGVDGREGIGATASLADRFLMAVQASADPAQPERCGFVRLRVIIVILSDQSIEEYRPAAAIILVTGLPVVVVITGGLTSGRTAV
jgi:hypothetical protein